MELFAKATRMNVRFESCKGALDIEDLWMLPLTSAKGASLDNIAQSLNREIKEGTEESFVEKPKPNPELAEAVVKLDVVKYIIYVRIVERDAAKAAAERKEKKAKIMAVIADKQDESLKQAPTEDLQKMLAEL